MIRVQIRNPNSLDFNMMHLNDDYQTQIKSKDSTRNKRDEPIYCDSQNVELTPNSRVFSSKHKPSHTMPSGFSVKNVS